MTITSKQVTNWGLSTLAISGTVVITFLMGQRVLEFKKKCDEISARSDHGIHYLVYHQHKWKHRAEGQ